MDHSKNIQIVLEFYTAFANRDAQAMAEHYHADCTFSDPVFGELNHARVTAMWTMLCTRGKDLSVQLVEVLDVPAGVVAIWTADYSYGKAQRQVHNRINASFEFKDGRIFRHRDEFNLWNWSRMAFGAPGLFLGWTGTFKRTIQRNAILSLERFRDKQNPA